jgi:glycosyltransferase involved in cell wall biosynthesis
MKPKFSVVVIARNEANTLPRLLESLNEFRDRGGMVIVLDTGSTDNTAEIARDLGCLVEEVGDMFKINISEDAERINKAFVAGGEMPIVQSNTKKIFDFAAARNYAATLADTDMISMPDCDEIFTSLDIDYVNDVIEQGFEQLEFNFVFSHDERGNEAIKFLQCKFYDRTKLKWVGIIHEVLQGSAKRTILPEDRFKIEHYQNETTDRSQYLTGLALDCFLHPDNDRNSHYFARELFYTGRFRSALKEFDRHIKMNQWPQEKAQSYIFCGDIWGRLNAPEAQVECYNLAIYIDGTRREPYMRLARFFQHNNDYQKAASYAAAAIQIDYKGFYADNLTEYRSAPYEILFWAHGWMGNIGLAREYYLKAYSFDRDSELLKRDAAYYFPKVSFIIPTLGRQEGLHRCLMSLENLNYPKNMMEVITIEGDETVPQKVKRGFAQSTGEYIVYGANDIEFDPDCIINALKMPAQYELIAFNTGPLLPDHGNICEHFMIKRSLVAEIGGEIFSTELNHVGVDNILWAKCAKLFKAARSVDARITHYHFSQGQPFDEVYEKGWSKTTEDRIKMKELMAKMM